MVFGVRWPDVRDEVELAIAGVVQFRNTRWRGRGLIPRGRRRVFLVVSL